MALLYISCGGRPYCSNNKSDDDAVFCDLFMSRNFEHYISVIRCGRADPRLNAS